MILTLIICTYKRPVALLNLLTSVVSCSIKPRDIIIVDSSLDDDTSEIVSTFISEDVRLNYYKVNEEHRGLTRQRNFGISKWQMILKLLLFLMTTLR
jgi:glycosyltransferase involved in cell wall biosynthesis